MQERYVIIKKYDGDNVRFNDRMFLYYFKEGNGFILGFCDDIQFARQFETYFLAQKALKSISEPGIYAIETIFIRHHAKPAAVR